MIPLVNDFSSLKSLDLALTPVGVKFEFFRPEGIARWGRMSACLYVRCCASARLTTNPFISPRIMKRPVLARSFWERRIWRPLRRAAAVQVRESLLNRAEI